MKKTILITGASGLIGGYLTRAVINRGDEYIAVSAHPGAALKKLPGAKKILGFDEAEFLIEEKIDAVINLAGANLGSKRWNDRTKKEFYDSRINTTRRLVDIISKMKTMPGVLVSASGVDYYGDTGNIDMYEDAIPAEDFLGTLTKDWELEASKAENYGIRVVRVRTGFVLASDSKAVRKLIMPYRFFTGGPLGSGKQYVSWIHINDLVGIYLFAVDNTNVNGAVNASSPNPVTMKKFSSCIGRALHRPSFFPVPEFALKLIAGEMAQVVLSGRKALPEKIMKLGYSFEFVDLFSAWKDVLSRKSRQFSS